MLKSDAVAEYRQARISSKQVMFIAAGGLLVIIVLVQFSYSALSLVLSRRDLPRVVKATESGARPQAALAAAPGVFSAMTEFGIELVWCPPGEFTMGSPSSESMRDGDEREHCVTLTRGFWMAHHEVTQSQWESIMGYNPSKFQGGENPVEQISWEDCNTFIRQLNLRSGRQFRLPTEAEWEYACRAGSTGMFSFGDSESGLGAYATYGLNSGATTFPAGGKQPNNWGLYDMHGNVWEWCSDWLGDYAHGTVIDPHGPATGDSRIIRGGSWNGSPANFRAANRNSRQPGNREEIVGFRLVLDAPREAPNIVPST